MDATRSPWDVATVTTAGGQRQAETRLVKPRPPAKTAP